MILRGDIAMDQGIGFINISVEIQSLCKIVVASLELQLIDT